IEGPFPCPVPHGDHIGDAESEAVAVRKAPRRVEAESRVALAAGFLAWLHPQKMLPHARHSPLAQLGEPPALLDKRGVSVTRLEAAVQIDLAALAPECADRVARAPPLRAVREIARPHRRKRRRAAQHEPGRDDVANPLRLEQLVDSALNGIPSERERGGDLT